MQEPVPVSAHLRHLVQGCVERMRAIESRFEWSDPDWWRRPPHARIVTCGPAGRETGFAIIGTGPYVDSDVASEVCDLLVTEAADLLQLVRRCLPRLALPTGFQILHANQHARRVLPGLLTRLGLRWQVREGDEHGARVLKYRWG